MTKIQKDKLAEARTRTKNTIQSLAFKTFQAEMPDLEEMGLSAKQKRNMLYELYGAAIAGVIEGLAAYVEYREEI